MSQMYLWEVTAETGRPAALGAGAHATNVLLTQDLVTALRVGTPGQVGAALHEASQKGTVILQEKAQDTNSFSSPSTHPVRVLLTCTYFGNSVLIGEDVVKELGGGLSPTVCDRTVAVHHQILFDTSSEVLLPAGLMGNRNSMTKAQFNITSHKRLTSYRARFTNSLQQHKPSYWVIKLLSGFI